jgi:quercetin dioxygenase-like cupin family protein|tara:strand:- start:3223 stop:3531 length:309 start_codon:yes stop_codon:yes gene_type:complete
METLNLADVEEYLEEYPVIKILHDSEYVRVVLFCLNVNQEIPVHVSSSKVVMQVLNGEGLIKAGKKEIKGKRGTIVFCDKEEPHGMKAEKQFTVLATIAPRP